MDLSATGDDPFLVELNLMSFVLSSLLHDFVSSFNDGVQSEARRLSYDMEFLDVYAAVLNSFLIALSYLSF